jgi:hypothetical protein
VATKTKICSVLHVPPLYYAESPDAEYRTASILVYLTANGSNDLRDCFGLLAAVFHCGSIVFQELQLNKPTTVQEIIRELQGLEFDFPCTQIGSCSRPRHDAPTVDLPYCSKGCFNKYHFPWLKRLCGVEGVISIETVPLPAMNVVHNCLKRYTQGVLSTPFLAMIIAAFACRAQKNEDTTVRSTILNELLKEFINVDFTCSELPNRGSLHKAHLEQDGDHGDVEMFADLVKELVNPSRGATFRGVTTMNDTSCTKLVLKIETTNVIDANNIKNALHEVDPDVNNSLRRACRRFVLAWNSSSIGFAINPTSLCATVEGVNVAVEWKWKRTATSPDTL